MRICLLPHAWMPVKTALNSAETGYSPAKYEYSHARKMIYDHASTNYSDARVLLVPCCAASQILLKFGLVNPDALARAQHIHGQLALILEPVDEGDRAVEVLCGLFHCQ